MSATRLCKKCLLREMPEEDIYKDMYEYLARLPQEDKAEKELYEQRLQICKECEMLLSGMCRLCGCFVEMRAAIKKRSCPGAPQKW